MQIVDFSTSNWTESYKEDFQGLIFEAAENMQMTKLVDRRGCFKYEAVEGGLTFCPQLDGKTISILEQPVGKTYRIAESQFNLLSGVRTINTSKGKVEKEILSLGKRLADMDRDKGESADDNSGTGVRWFQAVMGTVRKMNRSCVLMNGWIQMTIYLFSFISVVLLIIVYTSINRNREELATVPFLDDKDETIARKDLTNLLGDLKLKRQDANQNEEFEPPIVNNLLEPSLETLLAYDDQLNKGELMASVEAYGHGVQDRLERRFQIIRYFITAIPSLGFIGTIIGISEALGQTSALTGESLSHERIFANETLGQSLYIAFDTTLIALVANIILSLIVDWLENREISFVIDLRRKILNRFAFIKRLV